MSRAIISVAEFLQLRATSGVVVIDTRDAHSYARGHIPGAVNPYAVFANLAIAPLEELHARRSEFAHVLGAAGLSGAETAVIYEQSTHGGFGQSARAYLMLKYLGYPKIAVLNGGLEAWVREGGPVSSAVPTPQPKTFPLSEAGRQVLADAEAVLDAIDTRGTVLLDVRSLEEWLGDSASPYGLDFCLRKGRVPGARWMDFTRPAQFGETESGLKSRDEIRTELTRLGITPQTPIIVYCLKGARAANAFLALRDAGFENVRIYLGSWNEWSQDETLPIESGAPLALSA